MMNLWDLGKLMQPLKLVVNDEYDNLTLPGEGESWSVTLEGANLVSTADPPRLNEKLNADGTVVFKDLRMERRDELASDMTFCVTAKLMVNSEIHSSCDPVDINVIVQPNDAPSAVVLLNEGGMFTTFEFQTNQMMEELSIGFMGKGNVSLPFKQVHKKILEALAAEIKEARGYQNLGEEYNYDVQFDGQKYKPAPTDSSQIGVIVKAEPLLNGEPDTKKIDKILWFFRWNSSAADPDKQLDAESVDLDANSSLLALPELDNLETSRHPLR